MKYVASSISQMTDYDKYYVYTGHEEGMVTGCWYFWSGTEWLIGGDYQCGIDDIIETSSTMDEEGMPADAKAVGDMIVVSDTEPTSPYTELWIDPDTESVLVPTMDDIEGTYAKKSEVESTYARKAAVGSPLRAATASAMTDVTKIYVYTGSESGYTSGHWYYYNGSSWDGGGVYNSVAFVTDKTLTGDGEAADAKKVGDEVTNLKSALNYGKTAPQGYILTASNEGHGSSWSPVGLPTDEQTGQAVSDWLDNHPEATTTVQDGSLTESKLSESLMLKTIKDYVTPEMFGAVGDGVVDDTVSLQNALKYSIDNHKKLVLSKTYYITESLLTSNDYSTNVTINIEGTRPLKNYEYTVDGYGGIKFESGINVFDGLSLTGSIYRVTFAPTSRTQTGSIFHQCSLSAFTFDCCSVSNMLAFCHNTKLSSVSKILNSRFLTVYFFSKCDSTTNDIACTDSTIEGNYINGGAELNNNHCFEWTYFNGSTVINNFIDFYQTIFYPTKNSSGNFKFQGGVSTGNQYQVFRHLYFIPDNCTSFQFSSVSDCFNWTDPSKLEKLNNYDKNTFIGRDGNTHEFSPSILLVDEKANVKIKDAIIQDNCGKIVFIRRALTNYRFASAEFTGIWESGSDDYGNFVGEADSFYSAGTYPMNQIKIPFIKNVNALPSIAANYSEYYVGQLIRYNNRIYKYTWLYNTSNDTWEKSWNDVTAYI